jgi:hypothetical protein
MVLAQLMQIYLRDRVNVEPSKAIRIETETLAVSKKVSV